MDNKNLVAIVVLNHNRKNDVLECLESVVRQDYKDYVVIVVDNASKDGSIEAVNHTFPTAHLIENTTNVGAGPGRNSGWHFVEKKFDYNYLLFLDNDVIISKDFVTKLVSILNNNPEVGIVCGKAYTNDKSNTIMSAGIRVNLFSGSVHDIGSGKKDNGLYDQSGYVDACGGFGMLIRKELFQTLRGFDKNLSPYGWEDVDLCLRAGKHDYYTYYYSDALLIHKGSKLGRKPNPVYEKNKIKNYIYFLRSNTTIIQKITCVVCLPFRAIILALKLITKGNAKIVLEHFKGFFLGINNLKLSIKSNK